VPENVLKALNRFGFKENEVRLYMLCLQNSDGLSVAELTKQSGFKRSTVNLMLERLQKHGFITYHLEGSRKRFFAESPQVLVSQFEDSLDELKSLIPLLTMAGGSGDSTKVRFFEGKAGLEKMFADILLAMRINRDPKKEILLISSGKDIFNVLPDHQKQFIDKRVKAKISTRWIAPDSPVVRELSKKPEELRQLRYFDPKKYPFKIEIDIYGKNVAFMSLSEQPVGVIIENSQLAQSFASLFNLIWDSASVKTK
jgi:sugar-specific transcriptional regulator TrmB